MKFSIPISIPGWENIAEKYSSWVKFGEEGMHSKLVPTEDWEFILSIVNPAIKKISRVDHKINGCINFFVPPGKTRGIHVDWSSPDWPTKGNWALNIPIANYENSAMEWYAGEYTREMYHRPGGYISDKLTWKTKPVLIESCVINQPTLVYVDIPHDVRNNGTSTRVLMSLRLSPNILTYIPK